MLGLWPKELSNSEGITRVRIEDVAPYAGEHAIEGIHFRHLRQALGGTAWGMNVLEFAPHCTGYPEHDHRGDGQEEVYVVLAGSIVLRYGETAVTLGEGEVARVPPELTRALVTAERGATVLAIGATPGEAYVPAPGM